MAVIISHLELLLIETDVNQGPIFMGSYDEQNSRGLISPVTFFFCGIVAAQFIVEMFLLI